MLLAVIDARCGISFAQHDVYLNVAGGLKITEPAADLAAAAALLSSISNVALPPDRVYFGEISLSGAVRPAGHMLARLKEAQKLGFKQVAPAGCRGARRGRAQARLDPRRPRQGPGGGARAMTSDSPRQRHGSYEGPNHDRWVFLSRCRLLAIVVLSGIVAMYRGLTREVLSILSWIAAAAACVYFVFKFKAEAAAASPSSSTPRCWSPRSPSAASSS